MTPDPPAAGPTASTPAAADPLLLVSDQHAGRVHLVRVPSGEPVAALTGRHLSEHAGFLALPGSRLACVDDRAGELLVLDPVGAASGGPLVERAIPVAVPAEQLAADSTGRRLAVTTGLGAADTPWSDLLTVVDLPTGDAVRVRLRVGEPGVTLPGGAEPLVVVRQREPGLLAGHPHRELLAAGPGCPAVAPTTTLPLPDDGHGDAQDPATGRVFAATGAGVHRARLVDGALVAEPPLPWRSAGRGYFLRLDARRRQLWSCLRGGPGDPTRWSEWTNEAWRHELDTGRTEVTDLGPGLVFRMGLTRRCAAFSRVHPDGEELVLLPLESTEGGPRRVPLAPMAGAPRAGESPWEGVQRRAVAASPGSGWAAVSRGGHGEVQLVDTEGESSEVTLTFDSPLQDGGRLAMICAGDGAEGDPQGR